VNSHYHSPADGVNAFFATCPNCGKVWKTRNDFITDAKITLTGYQADCAFPEKGLFLLNHTCGAEFRLRVEQFSDLYAGAIFTEKKRGSGECPEYCLRQKELRPCPVQCECSYVREILSLF